MKSLILAAAVAALSTISTASHAATIGLQAEGGGSPVVYRLGNGNFLGLWGFDNREGANPGAGAVTISAASQIIDRFRGGARVVALYNGTNPVNPGRSEFDALAFGFTIANDARLSNSLWVEWTGGTLTYVQPNRSSTTSMAARATRTGDPFAVVVPPPPVTPPPVVPPVVEPPQSLPSIFTPPPSAGAPPAPPPVSVVPVPAALPLFLAALGALGLMSRRRKAV